MMTNEQIIQPDSIRSIIISSNEIIDVFKISKDDGWKLCDFIVSNEDRLLDFLPRTREQNLTPNLSELFVSSKVKEFDAKQKFLFTLKRKCHKDIIGLIYIKKLDWVKMQGEFAYAIDYNFEGKGIVSKVIQEMSNFGFL
jgi:ribosomal-protein-alanine N-acetyltransferase